MLQKTWIMASLYGKFCMKISAELHKAEAQAHAVKKKHLKNVTIANQKCQKCMIENCLAHTQTPISELALSQIN